MERAIITAHYSSFKIPSGEITEKVTLDDLLYYSLYWDHVLIPCNNGFYNELPQEESFIESGAIIRPQFQHGSINSNDLQNIASRELIESFKFFKDKNPDIDFSIHHNIFNAFDDLNYPDLIKQQAIRLELANLLPYPSNTNIYDLLEFKEKRKDELGDLHQYLTNIYLDIVNTSHSQDLKKLQVMSDFEKALLNLNKSMNENFKDRLSFRSLISDLKTDFTELGATATADAALATFPNGTVVGGITIFTKRVLTTILKEQKTESHLNYIKASMKDRIIT
ncbi:DUF6236 family protein [Acinetobacter towneri]|uniref:DUF6236 family protein n=1 Tax=Acinetobacter towneri TaxID=202956 RepID=UPI0032140AE0